MRKWVTFSLTKQMSCSRNRVTDRSGLGLGHRVATAGLLIDELLKFKNLARVGSITNCLICVFEVKLDFLCNRIPLKVN